jgi:DNA mismatch endonuclease, patch repair protein
MADLFQPEKRSNVMSRIRASGNRDTELRLIRLFREYGIRGWRRHIKVFGKPDFAFQRERLAVFVDGCFWHRHAGCKFCYTPKTRQEFWMPKFERNIARDRLVNATLRKSGWRVIRVWECHLGPRNARRVIARLRRALGTGS